MAPKFRVGIIGGGVAGVTMAVALARYPNIEVDIYEATAKFGEVGVGIGIWYRAWSILMKLGLHDLAQVVSSVPSEGQVHTFDFRKSDESRGTSFYEMYTRGGLITVHRAAFHGVLVKHLPKSVRIHCSKRLRSYSQSPGPSPVQMRFEDGTVASCDILIGADGIKSPVRRCMLQEKAEVLRGQGKQRDADRLLASIEPIWTGSICYRSVIPLDRVRAALPAGHRVLQAPVQCFGKDGHITMYPLLKAGVVNVAAFVSHYRTGEWTRYDGPPVETVPGQEVQSAFASWEPDVRAILSCMDSAMKWSVHAVKPFPFWYSGNVVLMGDAAHAFAPNQGSGAGQAIEDAYVLATLLGHELTTLATLPHALEVYQKIRMPFAYDIGARSHQNAKWFSLMDFKPNPSRSKQENLQELGRLVQSRWEWAWASNADKDCGDAIRRLEAVL